jgi:hypothetical protein
VQSQRSEGIIQHRADGFGSEAAIPVQGIEGVANFSPAVLLFKIEQVDLADQCIAFRKCDTPVGTFAGFAPVDFFLHHFPGFFRGLERFPGPVFHGFRVRKDAHERIVVAMGNGPEIQSFSGERLEFQTHRPFLFLVFFFPQLVMFGAFTQHLGAALGASLVLASYTPAMGGCSAALGTDTVAAFAHSTAVVFTGHRVCLFSQ